MRRWLCAAFVGSNNCEARAVAVKKGEGAGAAWSLEEPLFGPNPNAVLNITLVIGHEAFGLKTHPVEGLRVCFGGAALLSDCTVEVASERASLTPARAGGRFG